MLRDQPNSWRKIHTNAADKTLKPSQIKVLALRLTKNHVFHGNKRFSRKKANFMENVMAVKL